MGAVISRFWRKPSTIEVLRKIDEDCAASVASTGAVRRRQHQMTSVIVAYSAVLYLAAALVVYYGRLPDDMQTRVLCTAALLLFPAVVYFSKRFLTWYYERKIAKNSTHLIELKKRKERILDEVQDKETYKVAKEILEKFAPEQLRRSLMRTPAAPLQDAHDMQSRQLAVPDVTRVARGPFSSTPLTPVMRGGPTRPPQAGPPLPRPVLPRQRGYMDRVMDYLVGDGPANRYALICSQCQHHNGMALREEFEYLAFRCCYCYGWNPARKQRPAAPRLPAPPVSGDSMVESDTTETSESDQEVAEPSGALAVTGDAATTPSPGAGASLPAEQISVDAEMSDLAPKTPADTEVSDPAGEAPREIPADAEVSSLAGGTTRGIPADAEVSDPAGDTTREIPVDAEVSDLVFEAATVAVARVSDPTGETPVEVGIPAPTTAQEGPSDQSTDQESRNDHRTIETTQQPSRNEQHSEPRRLDATSCLPEHTGHDATLLPAAARICVTDAASDATPAIEHVTVTAGDVPSVRNATAAVDDDTSIAGDALTEGVSVIASDDVTADVGDVRGTPSDVIAAADGVMLTDNGLAATNGVQLFDDRGGEN